MKKVYLFAILFGAATIIAACGSKGESAENTEGEKTECCEGKKECCKGENKDCCQGEEKHECCKHARAEKFVSAMEAAQTIEELAALETEYMDLAEYEFSEEQQARMNAAAAKLGLE